jgi:hypothetical protein
MKTTATGRAAQQLIVDGLEVNAEIALEEPECEQGIDEDLQKLCQKYGVRSVLASIHCAAWTAGEVHTDSDDDEDMRALRLRVFSNRLSHAMDALK